MNRLTKLFKKHSLAPLAFLLVAVGWAGAIDLSLARYAQQLSPSRLLFYSDLKSWGLMALAAAFLLVLGRRHARQLEVFSLNMKRVLRKMNSMRMDSKHQANELDAILNNSLVGIGFVDSDMVFRRVNQNFARVMDCPVEAFIGRDILASNKCVLCFSLSVYLLKCNQTGEPVEVEFRAEFPGGKGKWLQVSITKVKAVSKMNGFVVVLRDITLRKENEDKIVYLSHHDFLTSLPNRRFFYDRLEEACKVALRYKESFCVLFMDINSFKMYNDLHGHEFGDAILREFARTVRDGLRESDVLARIGGDEFAAIVRGVGDREVCQSVVDKLQARLGHVREIQGLPVTLSASIGFSLFPFDGESLDALLNVADRSMYIQKDLFKARTGAARPAALPRLKSRDAGRPDRGIQTSATH